MTVSLVSFIHFHQIAQILYELKDGVRCLPHSDHEFSANISSYRCCVTVHHSKSPTLVRPHFLSL